jgi:hypothetical protein
VAARSPNRGTNIVDMIGRATATLGAAALALALAACGDHGTAASTKIGTPPTSVEQVCDAQSWPRPVPQVSGVIFDDAKTGSLACWHNLKAITPDGTDLMNGPGDTGPYRITDVSPPPGTLIARNDSVTLHVVAVDLLAAPPAFHPCDWATSDEAASFLGEPSVSAEPTGDEPGSVVSSCTYKSGSREVTSGLMMPGGFPVDAQTELNMSTASGHGSEVIGFPRRAYCSTAYSDGKTRTRLVVLLSGNRLYQALGWTGESCRTLKQFAQAAIPRIGP